MEKAATDEMRSRLVRGPVGIAWFVALVGFAMTQLDARVASSRLTVTR